MAEKKSHLFNVLVWFLIACSRSAAAVADYQFGAENKYFDEPRTIATALIREFYSEGRILLLGAAETTCL
jgi:hypothetical protein